MRMEAAWRDWWKSSTETHGAELQLLAMSEKG
jgi:hypothetical protein